MSPRNASRSAAAKTAAKRPARLRTKAYMVSVMSRDQVGIVSEIAQAIQLLEGNLADVRQSVLRDHFTMTLLVEFPARVTPQRLRDALAQSELLVTASIGIQPYQGPVVPAKAAAPTLGNEYMLTAAGPDQPGLVAALSSYLRERGINIVDLSSCIANGEYTMIWQIELPPGIEIRKLTRSLELSMKPLGMRIGLRHLALFKATNEI